MSVQRECCNYCMWYGPINKDGNMRKHRPATLDNKWGQPNKVQDMTAAPCPGSNKPHATFGCETTPDPKTEPQETTVTDTAKCSNHRVADERGEFTGELPVPTCQAGVTYGIWNENDGGFVHTRDCALHAANDAAEFLTEDPESDLRILAVCREHQEQPADTCEDCSADEDANE